MATKGSKRSTAKKGKGTPRKAAGKPAPRRASPPVTARKSPAAARPTSRPAGTGARGAAAPPPRARAQAPLIERAESLRDAIQRSKMTHADPWSYTPKARAWGQRAQQLLDETVRSGETPARRRALEALAAEVEGDRDFQEARKLF